MSEMIIHKIRLLVGSVTLIAMIMVGLAIYWAYMNAHKAFTTLSAVLIAFVISYVVGGGILGMYQNYKSHKG